MSNTTWEGDARTGGRTGVGVGFQKDLGSRMRQNEHVIKVIAGPGITISCEGNIQGSMMRSGYISLTNGCVYAKLELN